jgi:hypothetical protein
MIQPNNPFYTLQPVTTTPNLQHKKDRVVIILLSTLLGISLFVNIIMGLNSTGVVNLSPESRTYTTYNSPADLDSKAYQGELVQFRADPFDLNVIKGKSNEYMWRFSKADGKDYGIVLRFPLSLKPVATGIGLYSGKALSREVYGESKVLVIQVEGVKG